MRVKRSAKSRSSRSGSNGAAGENQAVALVEAQIGHDEPALAIQLRVLVQVRAAAIAEFVTAWILVVLACDAVRKCVDQQIADGKRVHFAGWWQA